MGVMSGACTLCDSACDPDEALCPSCLADPEERAAFDAAARASARASAQERWYAAAKGALRMARTYCEEGGATDPRAAACVDEANRCREAIRALRRGERASIPGLRKAARPAPARTKRERTA
jgi:hypothetical protein